MEKEFKKLKKIVDQLSRTVEVEKVKSARLTQIVKKEKSKVIRLNMQLSNLQQNVSALTRRRK